MTGASIKSYDKNGLRSLMTELGQPAYRARQVAAWLYSPVPGANAPLSADIIPQAAITCFEQMVDLPRSLRDCLQQQCTLDRPKVLRRQDSEDGSRKYLVQLAGGVAVETVAIPSSRGRLTVCFSTQAGCALGCIFCATGRAGLVRSLGAGEMVDQLLVVARDFADDPLSSAATSPDSTLRPRITNAVAMGQGEPFANYAAVLGALRLINDQRLLGIGARHLTVSSCGLLDGIHHFAEEPEQFTLAVSLHSAVQATRDQLMPGLINQPLAVLRDELYYYATITGRRPSLEYALIDGLNDSPQELATLIEFARGRGALNFHVNLLSLNAGGDVRLKPAAPDRLQYFAAALTDADIDANIRVSRGADIQGACGQLAGA